MQKNLVSLIWALALLAFSMPATASEGNLNDTVNSMLNDTINETASITLNETNRSDTIPESIAAATQLGAGNVAPHSKVLRAGFEKTKPVNNLDVYGNKSTYNIPFSASPSTPFNASQRLGNVSQFTYSTGIYKPLYNISQYSRTKPIYEVPSTISSKPVYSISGYPNIKTVNSIP